MSFKGVGKVFATVSYYYNEFRKGKTDDGWFGQLSKQAGEAEFTAYQILLRAGIYASGLSTLVCFALLMINSKVGGTKLAEAKDDIKKVMVVSALIFSVAELVSFVQGMAI